MTGEKIGPMFLCADDREIIGVLQAEQVLDKLRPVEPYNTAHYCFRWKDYYALATRHCGQAVESENGYTLALMPVALMSPREAADFFTELMAEASDGHICTDCIVLGKPALN